MMITKVSGNVDKSLLDPVLCLPLLRLSKETAIIGLPAVNGDHVYLLPVTLNRVQLKAGGQELLFVNWRIKYL